MTRLMSNLLAIATLVASGDIGSSEHRRFADVAIAPRQPVSASSGFYPEDRYIITGHGEELGWLFERMARAFGDEPGYGMWKEELFGRLGNAANWYLAHNPNASAQELCLAVSLEALTIADESSGGEVLPAPW